MSADPRATALFLGAFFDELARWGVHDMVVSPGSRSTPLTMTAFELSRREPGRLRVFVDVDERGAAFFALGLAKASGHPAAVVCTSGTAVANYYPAVMEAESSRVPLVVLTGDRPPRLQGLGAPQTCDQLNAYGNHVRAFRQMPLPSADGAALAFARQAAREAVIAAGEECFGGPVHLNFPFDEPLKPDFSAEGLFESARRLDVSRETSVPVSQQLAPSDAGRLAALLADRRALVYAGEGTCTGELEAGKVLNWARAFRLPLLADPLSGLRSSDDPLVIDNYDSVLGPGGAAPDGLAPEVVVRFGRYPVSKKATQLVAAARPVQIVVDPLETRDCNAATDVFVRCRPSELAGSLGFAYDVRTIDYDPDDVQRAFARAWIDANDAARKRIASVDDAEAGFEGAFVRRVVELAPEGSCLFSANSMSVRALDTFYLKSAKRLAVLCNRGLNGIDGTVSTALGAALLAIGMFLSSITESQGVAAGLCFVVMLVNYFISDLASYFSASAMASFWAFTVLILLVGGIFRLMTRNNGVSLVLVGILEGLLILGSVLGGEDFAGLFPSMVEGLSLFERFYQFVDGVFDLTSLVYFLTVIGVFLFLTVQSLEKRRWSE